METLLLFGLSFAALAFLAAAGCLYIVKRPDPRVRHLQLEMDELERLYDDNLRMLKRVNSREAMREVRAGKKETGNGDGREPDSVTHPQEWKIWKRKQLKIGPP